MDFFQQKIRLGIAGEKDEKKRRRWMTKGETDARLDKKVKEGVDVTPEEKREETNFVLTQGKLWGSDPNSHPSHPLFFSKHGLSCFPSTSSLIFNKNSSERKLLLHVSSPSYPFSSFDNLFLLSASASYTLMYWSSLFWYFGRSKIGKMKKKGDGGKKRCFICSFLASKDITFSSPAAKLQL